MMDGQGQTRADEAQEKQDAERAHRAWQARHEDGLVVDVALTAQLERRGLLHDRKGPGCR